MQYGRVTDSQVPSRLPEDCIRRARQIASEQIGVKGVHHQSPFRNVPKGGLDLCASIGAHADVLDDQIVARCHEWLQVANNERNLVVTILHNEPGVRQVTETPSRHEFGEILDVTADKLDRPFLKQLWTDVIGVHIESDDPSAKPKHAAVVEKEKGASAQARTEL